MTDMVPYFQNTGAAADGLHSRLSGVFWWAWNSNAGESLPLKLALDSTTCHSMHACMLYVYRAHAHGMTGGVQADASALDRAVHSCTLSMRGS